ncbi:hypothetical protein BBP40_003625 [Aspergillus hancockii]|nr:hypothetical protein BBP40_003625 [Aspergillus hancockii]
MEVSLFGSEIYHSDKESVNRLCSDVKLVPKLKEKWSATLASSLFDSKCPVGSHDAHMKSLVYEESVAWSRKLKDFPEISLAVDAPARLALVPRGKAILTAFNESFPVPDTAFWNAVAEQIYGFTWCLLDNNKLCPSCLRGVCSFGVLACFPDYHHFLGELHDVLEACAQRVTGYIEHVHSDHEPGAPEYMVMDAWAMCVQAVYLDVLHPKAERIQFPDNELRSIRYRLISAAGRALALHCRLEKRPFIGNDHFVDAASFASTMMHDICDCRHDNRAKEFYNLTTIVTGHTGKHSMTMVRRFCVDVWASALDNGAIWAIHIAGRTLAWQIYMTRYQTPVLLDNMHAPTSPSVDDPYGDQVLNSLNPYSPTAEPQDYRLRSRCQDKTRFDKLLGSCLAHFEDCSRCRGYDRASWQDRVPLIGSAYEKKYTDCHCLNMIATYMILDSPEELWWLGNPTAQYTGPTEDWSPLLC